MKYPPASTILFLLILLLFSACSSQQYATKPPHKKIYLDINANPVEEAVYHQQRNTVRWDYIDNNNNQIVTSFEQEFEYKQVSYTEFVDSLEKITGREFSKNTTYLIEYTYKDDKCTSRGNTWTKQAISKRKIFTTPNKKQIEKRNPGVIVLNFFEEGVVLKNSPKKKNEYFFQDKNNFLRNSIFINPSLCGSYAIVRPGGHTLIKNGESYTLYMEQFLDTNNWSITAVEQPENQD